jgi:lysophosphatidic acid acyltransferase / lysophosphatidylinositol acyltransferase
MFCEGTRFTKNKWEASMKVAREKGLKELKHHLLPRTKGFSLLARGAAGRSLFFIFKIINNYN